MDAKVIKKTADKSFYSRRFTVERLREIINGTKGAGLESNVWEKVHS